MPIRVFHTLEGELHELDSVSDAEKGSWIHVVAPTKDEIISLSNDLNLDKELLSYALDEDERSRLDQEEDQLLILVNFPMVTAASYDTCPLGIIVTDRILITISAQDPSFLRDFALGKVRSFDTHKKLRFALQILFRISTLYGLYLRQMSKRIDSLEDSLKEATKNEELLKMLSLSKSLVYFSTALRANQTVLEKIEKVRFFRIYEDDKELLDDTIIENRQSLEMCAIYTNILAGTMDTYASLISNNLNSVMKFLTTFTVLIMLPTFITSLYGMNVRLPMQDHPWAFFSIICFCLLSILAGVIVFFSRKVH